MRRVCVFSGSTPGARPDYRSAAAELGGELAARGVGLVYGGAKVGLMGVVADAVMAGGGEAIGVIPDQLMKKEIAHDGLTDLRVVASMHERKAMMADLADGIVALPGGFGTLEEFIEAVTWVQLGLQVKPCGLLDVAGFYQPLLRLVDHAVQERFIPAEHRDLIIVEPTPARLLDAMPRWQPPTVEKWVDRAPPAR
ncbi:MAG: TIGR00730 family Rossman fold protein [Streptosporangiales bacterium]|nr:TIGR00730 family Rossman fold protein [Streptosporangiales bacterium]